MKYPSKVKNLTEQDTSIIQLYLSYNYNFISFPGTGGEVQLSCMLVFSRPVPLISRKKVNGPQRKDPGCLISTAIAGSSTHHNP